MSSCKFAHLLTMTATQTDRTCCTT